MFIAACLCQLAYEVAVVLSLGVIAANAIGSHFRRYVLSDHLVENANSQWTLLTGLRAKLANRPSSVNRRHHRRRRHPSTAAITISDHVIHVRATCRAIVQQLARHVMYRVIAVVAAP